MQTYPTTFALAYACSPRLRYCKISKMRCGTIIFLIIILVLGFLLHTFSTLISLLFEDSSSDSIQPAEIPARGSELINNQMQLIPKIIYQTYINESIPAQ
jgi:uncharacterized protein involved in cysteine biosynthesis